MSNEKIIPPIRPREKLKLLGIQSLSMTELLALIIQTGTKKRNVMQISNRLAKLLKSEPDKISLKKLLSIEGIGFIKAAKILAVLELVKRMKTDSEESISRAADIYKLSFNIAKKKQEHFMLITLDGASCVIRKRIIFVGTINQSIIHPREIFHHAIQDRAASIILVHNHPSGNTTPSKDDVETTSKIKRIGDLVGINVMEHLIVSPNGYFSFYKSGLI